MSGYTVIDVETTGLSPEHHDRVVEIGVVYVSYAGQIQDHWSTLVDPGRDVGPTRIHGIVASDVRDAPTFEDVAPYILRAVSGRTIVAHNVSFDLRFLAAEMVRAGMPLTDLPLRGLCTMHWSPTFLDAPSRRLIDCCRAAGVALTEAHSAGADALATAQLLSYFVSVAGRRPPWVESVMRSEQYAWPAFHGTYPEMRMLHRSQARQVRQDAWLDRIVSRMPRAGSPEVDSYLALLEMALLDQFLAEHEKDALVDLATEVGLTRGQVIDIHGAYLATMADVALDDGVVTAQERADLDRVAAALGLRTADVEAALEQAQQRGSADRGEAVGLGSAGIHLESGDRVVFTGEMSRERGDWEAAARAAGLDPGGVTKRTKVVVAADPNSLSGKAAKARDYGVPIITEAAFAALLEG